jgi:hypothetical protein
VRESLFYAFDACVLERSVRRYIQRQPEHHRSKTFQEEYRELLEKAGIEYDERYLWYDQALRHPAGARFKGTIEPVVGVCRQSGRRQPPATVHQPFGL